MAPIPKGGTVAVTGSAGFIGGWVVRGLLDRVIGCEPAFEMSMIKIRLDSSRLCQALRPAGSPYTLQISIKRDVLMRFLRAAMVLLTCLMSRRMMIWITLKPFVIM